MRFRNLLLLAGAASCTASPGFSPFSDSCPAPCDASDNPSSNLTTYSNVHRLTACNETMLLDFSIHNSLDNAESSTKVYACTPTSNNAEKHNQPPSESCPAPNTIQVTLQLASSGSHNPEKLPTITSALEQVRTRLSDSRTCDTNIIFSYSQETAVGVYVGSKLDHAQVSESLIKEFITRLQENEVPDQVVLQHCGADADHILGIVADSTGDVAAVQKAISGWDSAQCTTGYQSKEEWPPVSLQVFGTTIMQKPIRNAHLARHLHSRTTCGYIKVASGDTCFTLAAKCGISGLDFEEYNRKKPNLCSSLAVGQTVCCSKGSLPDFSPKPGTDGYCIPYTVTNRDTCAKIAAEQGLSISSLQTFNSGTWGWAGCNDLMVGTRMCLSKGRPPMPGEVSNAVCGPQVPGTKQPGKGKELTDLNPCKLNACCNIWGQCGVASDFCTKSKSRTGAPGTAAPGQNGCISNCGTDIANKKPRNGFRSVAYFEAGNFNRPCMRMDVDRINTTLYNHVHFAFADITSDYHVNVSPVQHQFDMFVHLKGIKRIVSFGGWAFSTEMETYRIFRDGVKEANRQALADNVVSFIKKHNLDGVDFDWEYPGPSGIPGIPPGGIDDGANYVEFLKLVRKGLPSEKTISFATPASYWYLQGFHPIEAFEPLLDYMVFMSYDLHGQADYGSSSASPDCVKGNCLRSHVNYTETLTAMSMITKAGMPTNKVVMGFTRYGRSFKMTKPGCTGPMCTFIGPESAAAKGCCTDSAGYIGNAEIAEILQQNPTAKKWFDEESQSDIVVYNETEWVAYMDDRNWRNRALRYEATDFAGVSDWTVDLEVM